MQVQSFVTHVRFTEATAAIPKDVLLLEVGPHALLRAPLRQNLPGHQCAPHSCNLPPLLPACIFKGSSSLRTWQAVLHTSRLHESRSSCCNRLVHASEELCPKPVKGRGLSDGRHAGTATP